jgi:predicted transport protein
MSDIKLFQIKEQSVTQLEGKSVALERSLQTLVETHLEEILGIRFLSSEFTTGKTHRGRIDTLGLDENGCPCIIEYKRSSNENVINQGLFYLDWLMDHKGEFKLIVIEKLGIDAAEEIEWSSPRLLCIAGGFTKYDEHAVKQINRNIELLRYIKFGDDMLLLEMVRAVSVTEASAVPGKAKPNVSAGNQATSIEDQMDRCSETLMNLYGELDSLALALGDDVRKKKLKWYIAYARIRNFLSVRFQYTQERLLLHLNVDPDKVTLEEGFTRDLRGTSNNSTASLEVSIRTAEDIQKARPLIEKSYEAN